MKKNKAIFLILVVVVVAIVIFVFTQNTSPTVPTFTEEPSATVLERGYELASLPGDRSITITLVPQNGSLQRGHVAFRDVEGKVKTTIEFVSGFPTGASQPAHIHTGTCDEYGSIVHDLPLVVNGISDTTLDTSVDELVRRFPLVINVHKSVQEIGTVVACSPLVRF